MAAVAAVAQAQSIVVASTTSTEQSGLFRYLLPRFEAATGIAVKVVAVGTGQALDLARRGDADVLLVHDRAAEERFVADGWGVQRRDVMFNDFVLVGPQGDPARVRGGDIVEALRRIAEQRAPFVSRGDRSGTHAAELRYWALAGVEPTSNGAYRACGCGMGPALNIAAGTGAYVLTDRGTWLAFRNRADLVVLVEGDRRLRNEYGVILVNPARHPHVRAVEGQRFIDWLTGPAGQAAIADYRINGEPVFFPAARR
ncbi:substrate-binding domain-containing protein [Tepidimonas taiwanensis]|nr:substrate-binding domain-containing protein [Tepidimonas taiwanensis]MDM7464195.1 substrate-binding domain-containing protein [Tepidimonas taiwanensis]UBQ06781.1 substrate-binding domain-containing protein [Tepidimonas taiwanensis]